jgi:hypothetical protein
MLMGDAVHLHDFVRELAGWQYARHVDTFELSVECVGVALVL